ncbi:MAG: hypothetical protein Cons2KO_19060 [Congregibacter sp.]
MKDFADALSAYRDLLGDDCVVTDTSTLRHYETATFSTDAQVPAVLRPANIEQVQGILRIANEYETPIYPISTGLNTGSGSSVPLPASLASLIVELKRLDEIGKFNAELGYVRVLPGVTE